MENSTNTSEDMNSDISEVKPSLQATLDSGKPSSAFLIPGSPVKKETRDSCEEVADGGKDPVFADKSNRVQVKIDSSWDENNCPYSKYDKDEPELKGPITSYAQYQEYWQEYNDKHDSFLSLKKILEGYSDELKKKPFSVTMESYNTIYEKRKKIFLVLHAELLSIRQRIKDAVDEQERRKRLKAGNLTPEDSYKDPNIQAGNRPDRQGNSDVGFQKGNNQALPQTGQRSSDEIPGNFTDGSNGSKLSQLGASPKDKIRIDLNKSPDDMNSDITEVSVKHTNTSEDINSDITKVKSLLKTTLDSGKPSSAFDSHFEDSTKSHPRVVKTHLQHLKADNAEIGSQNKLTEMSSKFRKSKSGENQDIDLDGSSGMVSHPVKESKGQMHHSCEKVADGGIDSVFADRDNWDKQKRESSSDEYNHSYLKYNGDEPELKGQYEEYVLHKELSSIKVVGERKKRLEAGNLTPEDTYKEAGNRADRQGSSDVGFQKGNNQALPQTGQRSSDEIPLGNPSYPLEKSDKHGESIRHNRKHSGRDFHAHELFSVQKDKTHGDARNEKIPATEKKIPRNSRDGSNGSKLSVSKDSSYQKQGEMVGKLKEGQQDTLSQLGASPKDNNRNDLDKSPGVDRQGICLQREFSDLNLGKLHESTPDETRVAKQFERKGPFKHTNTSEVMISDITKGQTPNSCEEVADGGKDSVFSDRVNRDEQKRESSSDESSCSYTKYIQYQEYVQEFKDKYDSYLFFVKILDSYCDEFKKLGVDMDGYNELKELIEETCRECNVRFEELSSMKRRIEDFVENIRKFENTRV